MALFVFHGRVNDLVLEISCKNIGVRDSSENYREVSSEI
jgi:hypothetical protein